MTLAPLAKKFLKKLTDCQIERNKQFALLRVKSRLFEKRRGLEKRLKPSWQEGWEVEKY